MDTSTLLILLVLGVVLGAGGVMVGLTLARRGRGDESPLTAEALRPVLDELTRGAINEALGTSGMQLSEQLRSATEERLRTQQEATEAQSRAAQDVMRQLVEPLTKGVEKLDTQVRALEQARADAYGRLHEQVTATAVTLEALQTATGHLDRAMRSNQVRGQWGELQLQRIVELVGLKEHVSYEQQVQQVGTGTGRPDLTVHLTDGKVLYIDAKAPMAAFLRAIEEDDRDRQREHLAQHAKDLLLHVRAIAERGYLDDGASIGMVALFVPNEAALAAALDADPELLSRALALRVAITGPTSLAMMLTNVSASWRQQNLADNAERIVGEVLELHKRLGIFVDHLAKLGKHLTSSVGAFNAAVASFERRLLPSARRVEQLAAVPDDARLDDLVEVETVPTLGATAQPPLPAVTDDPAAE
ncbi:MAG: DNA recombination protein RmuC [Actinomycetota bacterium]|nr:DNA recombination protein RmuC [Actinomycetota bacterium]